MNTRRNFLRNIGSLSIWTTPIVTSIYLPAHAQTSDVTCTTEVVPGIQITVFDSQSSENISCLASATISEESYSENLIPESCPTRNYLEGAFERAGTYQVEVIAQGYVTSPSIEVIVDEDSCHVITQFLNINLEPE